MNEIVLQAELTWTGEQFDRGVQIEIGSDGRIGRVGKLGVPPTLMLERQAVLPGMISAHSHAFQRGLRGQGEFFPAGEGSFWSWRESMYRLVEELDPERFYELTRLAYGEMLAAGITTVGEFHYLHHSLGANDYAYDELVLEAARDAGIRLVLLNAFYRTGSVNRPLEGPQLRFATNSLDEYWKNLDLLAPKLDPQLQSLAAVAHSIRAASPDEIGALYEEATRRGMVFHIHVEEQQQEIDEAFKTYGKSPMRILLDHLEIGSRFTAVHCTHTRQENLREFLTRGGNVCLAPLTEANLGDGTPNGEVLRTHTDQLALGSDSNARISLLEEMRWLEYAQRLRSEARGIFRSREGATAPSLMRIATTGGARSLGVQAGAIAPGRWADLVAIDLESPSLLGWSEETLLDGLVFGASEAVILSTCVAGRWTTHREPRFS